MEQYKHERHRVHRLTYHFVFVTKYRRPVISEEVGVFLKQRMQELISLSDGELLACETDVDHIHILAALPPDIAPAAAVRGWKTALSVSLHKNEELMPFVRKYLYGEKTPLWSASYFVATTGGVTMETIREYVNSQQSEEHQKRRYEKTGRYKGAWARSQARKKNG
ncbi:MAG: IS200/IS605 family transposase [Eubacteriales bacterium]|nr:IS200/IS605 family transposase [Eubacteriales bacterium]